MRSSSLGGVASRRRLAEPQHPAAATLASCGGFCGGPRGAPLALPQVPQEGAHEEWEAPSMSGSRRPPRRPGAALGSPGLRDGRGLHPPAGSSLPPPPRSHCPRPTSCGPSLALRGSGSCVRATSHLSSPESDCPDPAATEARVGACSWVQQGPRFWSPAGRHVETRVQWHLGGTWAPRWMEGGSEVYTACPCRTGSCRAVGGQAPAPGSTPH